MKSRASDHTCMCWTSLAQPTTVIPQRTSSSATTAPIPTEAPVTRATLPLQRSITAGTPVTFFNYEPLSTTGRATLNLSAEAGLDRLDPVLLQSGAEHDAGERSTVEVQLRLRLKRHCAAFRKTANCRILQNLESLSSHC